MCDAQDRYYDAKVTTREDFLAAMRSAMAGAVVRDAVATDFRIVRREAAGKGRVRIELAAIAPDSTMPVLVIAPAPPTFNDHAATRTSDGGWCVQGPGGLYHRFHAHQRLHAEILAAALDLRLDEVARLAKELRGIA